MRLYFFIFSILIFSSCFQIENQKNTTKKYYHESAENILPKNLGWVSDYSNIFTQEEKNRLTELLQNYSTNTTNEIAILTIPSIEPYTDIKDYSTDLGNYWGIGHKEKNNGLLLVLSTNDRELRIATGKGTEKVLTDAYLSSVIDSLIIPKFKEKKFYEGLVLGIDNIILNWQ
jgi:uncharacterized protein